MNEPASLPWGDCKIAFGIDDGDAVFRNLTDDRPLTKLLPQGWELIEVDCSCFRCVAIFRVEVHPTIADGNRVSRLLKRADRQEDKKSPENKPIKKGWINAQNRTDRRAWKPKDDRIVIKIEKHIGGRGANNWTIWGGGEYITARQFRDLSDAKNHVMEQFEKHQNGEAIDVGDAAICGGYDGH